MNRTKRTALKKLLNSKGVIQASAFTKRQRDELDALSRNTGCLALEARGAGAVYIVRKWDVLELHYRQESPVDEDSIPSNIPLRSRNIANTGSSKGALHSHEVAYLLIKAAKGGVIWRKQDGYVLLLHDVTDRQGASVLAISDNPKLDSGWHTKKALWLVENQILFDNLDWFPGDAGDSVAWYRGNLPNILIQWLSLLPRCSMVYFFPDYDGTGLSDYAKIKEALGDGVTMWIMPGWRNLLNKTGNTYLWKKEGNLSRFKTAAIELKKLDPNEELHELMNSMESSGKALEQEAVYLDINKPQ